MKRLGGRHVRLLLLVALPAAAAVLGLWLYLSGGRYVSTDNAYVGAQKVLITPDISGHVASASVREGERVRKGDLLFTVAPATYLSAVREAEARRELARSDWLNLEATLTSVRAEEELARRVVEARRTQLGKRQRLVDKGVAAEDAMNDWSVTVATAERELAQLEQEERQSLARLLGDASLPLERFPAYMQADAALEKARRDLANTEVKAPVDGIATQVANIQVGRYLAAGTPVLAVIAEDGLWVDANLKETDLTHVAAGQQVSISVDSYPGETWRGSVQSISPGTGAEFSILPPQNAAGNWVKVVQRVPVRIAFAAGEDTSRLRAGLSVVVSIDTGRSRTLAGLLGLGQAAAGAP